MKLILPIINYSIVRRNGNHRAVSNTIKNATRVVNFLVKKTNSIYTNEDIIWLGKRQNSKLRRKLVKKDNQIHVLI